MALPKNREAVKAILAEISPRIIGQHHAGFTCNCGAVHAGPGVVTQIEPAGDDYPGQETSYFLWSVQIRYHPEDPNNMNGFGCGLSEFIPPEELQEIFAKHFGKNPPQEYPYRLAYGGEKRFRAQMPIAVRILENNDQIRFCFDWGKDQEVAKELNKISRYFTFRRGSNGGFDFKKVIEWLEKIQSPYVYAGGPEPELPFESTWHTDFQKAVEIAKNTDHVFLQCGGSFTDYRGTVETNGDVVFMKYHLD